MNSRRILAAAAALAALCACSRQNLEPVEKQEEGEVVEEQFEMSLTINEGDENTKTYIEKAEGYYAPHWSKGDQLGVLLVTKDAAIKTGTECRTLTNQADSAQKASFYGTVTSSYGDGDYDVYSFYPKGAYSSRTGSVAYADILHEQSPTATSFDPLCDLLVGEKTTATFSSQAATIDGMRFARVMAVLKVVVKDSGSLLSADEYLHSVRIATSDTYLTGYKPVDLATGVAGEGIEYGYREVIGSFYETDKIAPTDGAFLIVNPCTIPSGTTLTFDIRTSGKCLTRDIVLPYDIKMPAGEVTTLTINLKSTDISDAPAFEYPYKVDFEQGFKVSTSYKHSTAQLEGPSGYGWYTVYGTVSTTSKISGKNSMYLRHYENDATVPSVRTAFKMNGLKKVSFKALTTTSGKKFTVSYSLDGENWLSPRTYSNSTGTYASNINYFVNGGDGADCYIKIESSSDAASDKQWNLVLDDFVFYDALDVTSTLPDQGWLELPAGSAENPDIVYGTFYSGERIGAHRNYTYQYDKSLYTAMWTAYPLCKSQLSDDVDGGSWAFNPEIAQEYQVNVTSKAYENNYGNGAYARGHQIPNADRKLNSAANQHTYYVTNQTPQIQSGFNSGIWNSLEGSIRDALPDEDTVYMVTGASFQKLTEATKEITYLTSAVSGIEPAQVPVPNFYWKALLKVRRDGSGNVTDAKAVAIWLPHKSMTGKKFTDTDIDGGGVVSVDELESYTGFDFFANLSTQLQASAEANASWTEFTAF